jgi:hypothetical protein
MTLLLLLACAAGDDTAAPDDTATDTAPDTTAPTVVSISPAYGATGVTLDAVVVIVFSEAMDPASVDAALLTTALGDAAASWNDAGDTLTLTPTSLTYAEGKGLDPNSVTANRYGVTLGSGATDLAGNPLPVGTETEFTTLKRLGETFGLANDLTGTATAEKVVSDADSLLAVGDDPDDIGYRSFVSFDLSALPWSAVEIEHAVVFGKILSEDVGTPYKDLGDLIIESGTFRAMDNAAYNLTPLHDGVELAETGDVDLELEVTGWVEDDRANKEDRGYRSQYRVRFEDITDLDGEADAVFFSRDDWALAVTYLVP